MLTDLAFLQTPPQLASESDGKSPLLSQPAENIEFSSFLPVLEQTQLPASTGPAGQLSAPHPIDPAILDVLSGGQLLPPGGEPLPDGALLTAFDSDALPTTMAIPQLAAEAQSVVPAALTPLPQELLPAASSLATPAPTLPLNTVPLPEASLPALPLNTVPLPEGPLPALPVSTLPSPAAPLPAAPVNTAPKAAAPANAGLDGQNGMPATELTLERQLPPQLAIALHQVRQGQMPAETTVQGYGESLEPGVEDVQLRLVSNERSSLPRVPATPVIDVNVTRPDWQPSLGQRLVWMVSHGQQRAELKLDPPQLGRVDVQIVMQGDRAQLVFAAETSVSRELLEQSLPRLREMMADAGVELDTVDVANRERQSSQQDAEYQAQTNDFRGQEPEPVSEISGADSVSGDSVLLDLFV